MSNESSPPGGHPNSPTFLQGIALKHPLIAALWENCPSGIILIVPGKETSRPILIGDCNDVVCKLHGYSRDEIVGQSMDLIHAMPWTHTVDERWFTAPKEGDSMRGIALHKHKEGSTFMIEYDMTFITLNGIRCAIGFDRMAEDRTAEQDALHSVANRWVNAMESSEEGVWEITLSERLIWTSPRWQAILGKKQQETEIDLDKVLESIHPEDIEKLEGQLDRIYLKTANALDTECRIRDEKNQWIWIHLRGKATYDAQGTPDRVLGSMTNITERKESEEILKRTREKAEAANNAKTQFLAVMSHEIRTPMNGVIGMAAILANTKLDEEQRLYLKTIENSGDSLLVIIDEILNFSKLESGSVELENFPFQLEDCIHGAISTVSALAAEKDLELLLSFDPRSPQTVIGDEARLRQVILNIIGNAIKFTNQGEIEISLSSKQIDDSRIQLSFDIRDTGIGIDPEAIKRLFEPFTQVDASTTRNYGGTGLGLAICKRLLKLMDGNIDIVSEVGVGSTFKCSALLGFKPGNYLESDPRLQCKRALILENNKRSGQILIDTLAAIGLVANIAADRDSIFKALLSDQRFDCLILNQSLLRDDTENLLAEIEQSLGDATPPIICLEAIGAAKTAKPDFEYAMRLTKPITPTQIKTALENTLLSSPGPKPEAPKRNSDIPIEVKKKKEKILLVEDNRVNQLVAGKLIKLNGYEYDVAENGVEALKACAKQSYDIILMDLQMPGMSGYETVETIRAQFSATPKAPWIIALTADALESDRKKCLAIGMNDYITKPIRPGELKRILTHAREVTKNRNATS